MGFGGREPPNANKYKKIKIINFFCSSGGIAKHDLRCVQFADTARKVNKRVTQYQKIFEPI
jgi:hypothetical protein